MFTEVLISLGSAQCGLDTLNPSYVKGIPLGYAVHCCWHLCIFFHWLKSMLNKMFRAVLWLCFHSTLAWFQSINMWFKFRLCITEHFPRDVSDTRLINVYFCWNGLTVSSSSCLSTRNFPCRILVYNIGIKTNDGLSLCKLKRKCSSLHAIFTREYSRNVVLRISWGFQKHYWFQLKYFNFENAF